VERHDGGFGLGGLPQFGPQNSLFVLNEYTSILRRDSLRYGHFQYNDCTCRYLDNNPTPSSMRHCHQQPMNALHIPPHNNGVCSPTVPLRILPDPSGLRGERAATCSDPYDGKTTCVLT
jgi:hypothetical protein